MKKTNLDGTVRDVSASVKPKVGHGTIVPKLMCLLAAFVLWIYVMQTESPEYTADINSISVSLENVSVIQSSYGLSVYSGGGESVNVKLSGKKSVVSHLTSDDIKIFADVSRITDPGRHAVDLTVELPDGVVLLESYPSSITVYADKTETVSLAVKEKLQGMVLTSPYELGTVELEYDSITVTGPKTKISTLAEAQISVDMSGKTSSFTSKCPVTLMSTSGYAVDTSYLTLSATEMNVRVPIYITKELPVSAVFKYGLIDDSLAKITISPQTITVRGDETAFEDTSNMLKPIEIDERQIIGSTYSLTVRPTLTSDITVDLADDEITVTVELDSSLRTKEFTVKDIQITGAPSGLDFEILDREMTVVLRGTVSQLNAVSASDISLIVDLAGYDPQSTGQISKSANVVIDAEDADGVYGVGEYTVQIKIN